MKPRLILPALVLAFLSACTAGGEDESTLPEPQPSNTAPTAPDVSASVNYGGQLSGVINAHDAENDPMTFEVVDMPPMGILDLDPATGAYTYVPPVLRVGTDSFTYRVSDGQLASDVATVTITVNPAYDICEHCIPDFQEPGLMERGAKVVDLNQDGLADFYYAGPPWVFDPDTGTFNNDNETPLRVLINDGAGNFTDGTALIVDGAVPAFSDLVASVVADMNDDGFPDLYLADHGRDDELNAGRRNVLMLSNAAGRLFDATANISGRSCDSAVPPYAGAPVCATADLQNVYEGDTQSPPPLSSVHSLASADIDGDGDTDIFVGTIGWPLIQTNQYFLINDGRGNLTVDWAFVPIEIRMFGGGPQWISAELADLDGDGAPDLVVGGAGPSFHAGRYAYSMIFWNDGTGDFSRRSLCEAALDGGCDPTLSNAQVTVLPTVENRTYPTETIDDPVEKFHLAAAVATADIDGDDDLDLLVANAGNPPDLNGWEGRYIQVFVNNGDRTFSDQTSARLRNQTGDGRWIAALKIIDFDGDGHPDLLAQHDNLSGIGYSDLIWINDGTGAFNALDNNVLGMTGWLHPIDIHGDGDLDFIVYNDVDATSPTHVQDFSLLIRRPAQ